MAIPLNRRRGGGSSLFSCEKKGEINGNCSFSRKEEGKRAGDKARKGKGEWLYFPERAYDIPGEKGVSSCRNLRWWGGNRVPFSSRNQSEGAVWAAAVKGARHSPSFPGEGG